MTKQKPDRRSCGSPTDPLTLQYHDREWGVPVHDDRTLFESLTLQGAQAGLSWRTILNKRANYRRAFDGFDPERVARYSERDAQHDLPPHAIDPVAVLPEQPST